jgi:hypothetical protein
MQLPKLAHNVNVRAHGSLIELNHESMLSMNCMLPCARDARMHDMTRRQGGLPGSSSIAESRSSPDRAPVAVVSLSLFFFLSVSLTILFFFLFFRRRRRDNPPLLPILSGRKLIPNQ